MSDHPLVVLNGQGATEAQRARACVEADLMQLVRGDVRFGHHDRMLYATDASIYQVPPLGIVIAADLADVEAVVSYCGREGLPILPRGGGTSLAGQAVNRAVVLDLSRHCTSLISVDPESWVARVEPGIVLDHLNRQLASHGLMFGPDVATASHATLGGMIGNNSAGAHSVLYGRTVEHVRALKVMLADGRIVHLHRGASTKDPVIAELTKRVAAVVKPIASTIRNWFPKTLRHVDGYNLDLVLDGIERSTPGTWDCVNLADLFCGSEGTLGVTLEAELGLVERPPKRGLAILAYPDVQAALTDVTGILGTGPSAVELIDDVVITLARSNAEYRRYVERLPNSGRSVGAVLYVEYFADDDAELNAHLAAMRAANTAQACECHTDNGAMTDAWRLRKAGEPLLYGMPGPRKPITFIEDAAVEPSQLNAFVKDLDDILTKHGTKASYYAHASVGCLHVRPMIALKDEKDRRTMARIAEEATDLVLQYGGALSGEHGDGRLRSHLLHRFYGSKICDAFRQIKEIFDPKGLMNPGIIVDPSSMTESLRVMPFSSVVGVPEVETYFTYQMEGGLGEAVEMCNGAGICRRTTGGTMCPSYHATRDERHATRGRGNALRLAMTGQFEGGFNDAQTHETLDLCLSCKACKTECPSNVDIAKLKSEFLAQHYRSAGVPRNVARMGEIRRILRDSSRIWPLADRLRTWPLTRRLITKFAGVDSRRSLPPVGPSLHKWFARRGQDVRSDGPTVILFPDCFSIYSEPAIGRAAVEVLEAFGYRVILPEVGCCGRPRISNGLLHGANVEFGEVANSLNDAIRKHNAVSIVACEPSCASAISDDWPELKLSIERGVVESVSSMTQMIESFLDSAWDSHPNIPGCSPHLDPIRVHGHCHQKALWSMESTVRLLNRFAPQGCSVIDAGCCGMAGAFGLSSHRYDLSMRIGETALFPAIRGEPQSTTLAPGASCRHQILDGTGVRSHHPIEFIARAINHSPA